MRVVRTRGAIKLTATTDSEVKELKRMVGKTFKVADWCTPHTTKAKKKSDDDGILDLWLDEVRENVSSP